MRFLLAAAACLAAATATAGQVAIEAPRDGETINDAAGRIAVVLRSSLIPGERVQLLLNGVQIQMYGAGDRLTLLNVERGQHRLEAQVVDEKGAVVATYGPVTFNLIRVAAGAAGRGAPPVPTLPTTGTVPNDNPATTVGAPNPNNPPGAIGAPSTSSPPTAIGTPNPNNPPAAIGTPSSNAPASGVGAPGAPGPNNPAATVGRPAASAPGR